MTAVKRRKSNRRKQPVAGRLILLNGPLGVGKSSVAEVLVERMRPAVNLDIDHAFDVRPFHLDDPDQIAHGVETLAMLIEHHLAYGYRNFVANWVFESPQTLAQLKKRLASLVTPVLAYRLHCPLHELSRRVSLRGRPQIEWELRRARALHSILEHRSLRYDLGLAIDTSDRSIDEVVQAIWHHAASAT